MPKYPPSPVSEEGEEEKTVLTFTKALTERFPEAFCAVGSRHPEPPLGRRHAARRQAAAPFTLATCELIHSLPSSHRVRARLMNAIHRVHSPKR